MDSQTRINIDLEANINSFAASLRDRADEDYLTARLCYHNDLMENYFWNALQCIEKYLKTLVIFHDIKGTATFGHNLNRLYTYIDNQIGINSSLHWPTRNCGIMFEESLPKYLNKIHDLGMDRYYSSSYTTIGDEIIKLDSIVFILRKYCQPFTHDVRDKGQIVRSYCIKDSLDEGNHHPIITGYLEKVLSSVKPSHHKDILLKSNKRFGKEGDVVSIDMKSKSVNHILHRRYCDALRGSDVQKTVFCNFAEHMLGLLRWDRKSRLDIESMIESVRDNKMVAE